MYLNNGFTVGVAQGGLSSPVVAWKKFNAGNLTTPNPHGWGAADGA